MSDPTAITSDGNPRISPAASSVAAIPAAAAAMPARAACTAGSSRVTRLWTRARVVTASRSTPTLRRGSEDGYVARLRRDCRGGVATASLVRRASRHRDRVYDAIFALCQLTSIGVLVLDDKGALKTHKMGSRSKAKGDASSLRSWRPRRWWPAWLGGGIL